MDPSDVYYSKISHIYREISDTRSKYIDSVDALARRTLSEFADRKFNWLDVGTGDGFRLGRLSSGINCVLTVVEPVRDFRDSIRKHSPGAVIHHSKVESFGQVPSKNFGFDFITCLWNVVGHSEDPQVFLDSLRRLVTQNGLVFIDLNNRLNVSRYGALRVARNLLVSRSWSWSKFRFPTSQDGGLSSTLTWIASPSEIAKLAVNAGFEIEQRFYVNYETGKISNLSWWSGQIVLVLKPSQVSEK